MKSASASGANTVLAIAAAPITSIAAMILMLILIATSCHLFEIFQKILVALKFVVDNDCNTPPTNPGAVSPRVIAMELASSNGRIIKIGKQSLLWPLSHFRYFSVSPTTNVG
jgi:hypothetical protein